MILLLATAIPAAADDAISFNGYTWDPLLGLPPGIGIELRTESYAAGTRGLWIVQCTVPFTSQVTNLIGATGFLNANATGYASE